MLRGLTSTSLRARLPPPAALSRSLRLPPPPALSRSLATSSSDDNKKKDEKPSRWQQLKTTVKEHGVVFVGYYATTYFAGFGVSWAAVTFTGLDGVALLQYLGADQVIDTSMFSARMINALIAAEINETFDIVRLPFVIATTPMLSRRLRGPPADDKSSPAEKPESKPKS